MTKECMLKQEACLQYTHMHVAVTAMTGSHNVKNVKSIHNDGQSQQHSGAACSSQSLTTATRVCATGALHTVANEQLSCLASGNAEASF